MNPKLSAAIARWDCWTQKDEQAFAGITPEILFKVKKILIHSGWRVDSASIFLPRKRQLK